MNKPLTLNAPGFDTELSGLADQGVLPQDLTDFLKSIVFAHVTHGQLVKTESDVIKLVREHLLDGIIIFTSTGKDEGHYDIGVYVPDGSSGRETRSFFYLIPRRSGMKLKYLTDLPKTDSCDVVRTDELITQAIRGFFEPLVSFWRWTRKSLRRQ